MVKNLQYFIVLLSIAFLLSAFSLYNFPPVNQVKVVVIDPGHGGKDPGCLGIKNKEKDVALSVALKLGKYLEDNFKDVKVVYTRSTDIFVELEDRALIANKAKADLFISIHCNAAGKPLMVKDKKTGTTRPKKYKNKKGKWVIVETANPVPFGTETYVMGLKNEEGKMKVAQRENSAIFYEDDYEKKYGGFDPESEESYIIMSNYTSAYVIQSASLAMKIQEEYTRKAGRVDKGVHRQSLWVLWRTSMPSILTEIGYLTNPLEEEYLASNMGQEYIARALFRGFRKYKDEVEGRKKEYTDEFEKDVPLENENIKAGNTVQTKNEGEEEIVEFDEELSKEEEPIEKENKATEIKVVKSSNAGEDTAVSAKEIATRYSKNSKEEDEPKDNTNQKPGMKGDLFFKVQFASTDVNLDLKQEKFESIIDVDFYKVGNVLKYTSGKFMVIRDASAHQTMLREKGFKDCFVVAFKNGQRIDMADARKILEESQK